MTLENSRSGKNLENQAVRLERDGDEQMAANKPARAFHLYLEASTGTELPPGRLLVKLARSALASGNTSMAVNYCKKVVDSDAGFAEWAAASAILSQCPSEAFSALRTGLRVALVSTWTTKTYVPLLVLAAARCGLHIEIREADYGQYFVEALSGRSALLEWQPDVIVLMPDYRALSFDEVNEHEQVKLDNETERWTEVWDSFRDQSNASLVQLGFALPSGGIFGNFGSGLKGSFRTMSNDLNARIAYACNSSDVSFVDVDELSARSGKGSWFDNRSWYLAKIPYSPNALCRLAHETAIVISARMGLSRRCLILDLDNTLWGGVIGDDGLAGIQLGEGVKGEAYLEFQQALKDLSQRGILLAVCSKNDPIVAREPFEKHPEMVLGISDISAFAANWEAKSHNISAISKELNLGLESITFFDDNPYEREEVRRQLPELDVPVMPSDPASFRRMLEEYPYFEPVSYTHADKSRADQYHARAKATELRDRASSLKEYQVSLKMVARIGAIDDLNMSRVVQLINKTNQFNLTTRRRNRAELEEFLANPNHFHFWVRLSDRFADHGLIAVVLCVLEQGELVVDTLLMSCRVIGRDVEAVIMNEIASIAIKTGARKIRGEYFQTNRNGIVAELYARLGFSTAADVAGAFLADPKKLTQTTHIEVIYATR